MTLGQLSELCFMVIIPWFFHRLGVKYILAASMLAWGIRCILFAYGDASVRIWVLFGGIALHGICYDFFFARGQIYVDNNVPQDARAAAQGLISLATYGVEMFVGSYLYGYVVHLFRVPAAHGIPHHSRYIWTFPAAISALVLIFFLVFFNTKSSRYSAQEGELLVPATPT